MPALGKLFESILETRLSYKTKYVLTMTHVRLGSKEIAGPSIIFLYYNPL